MMLSFPSPVQTADGAVVFSLALYKQLVMLSLSSSVFKAFQVKTEEGHVGATEEMQKKVIGAMATELVDNVDEDEAEMSLDMGSLFANVSTRSETCQIRTSQMCPYFRGDLISGCMQFALNRDATRSVTILHSTSGVPSHVQTTPDMD
jgi:hypothetical protein